MNDLPTIQDFMDRIHKLYFCRTRGEALKLEGELLRDLQLIMELFRRDEAKLAALAPRDWGVPERSAEL